MRRILFATALAAASLGGFGGSAGAVCAGEFICAGTSGCTGGVNVCPTARDCSGIVNACPTATSCWGTVNVCDVRVPVSR